MKKLEFTLESFKNLTTTVQKQLIEECLRILGPEGKIVIDSHQIKTRDDLHDFQIKHGIVLP